MDARSWLLGCFTGAVLGMVIGTQVPMTSSPRTASISRDAALAPLLPEEPSGRLKPSRNASAPSSPNRVTHPLERAQAPSARLQNSKVLTWDPLVRFRSLCEIPNPSPEPWAEVARGLERIDATPEAIESWWQVFRRKPDHHEAEIALLRLSPQGPSDPGELAKRMERELQRFPRSFPERRAMEIRLAPVLLAQGRSAEAFQLFRMDPWLRGMQKRSEPRFGDFSRPHLWSVLTAHDPLAAESLLVRGLSTRGHERQAAPLFLQLLQQQGRDHEWDDYRKRWQISDSTWRSAREKVGWDRGKRSAIERYEEDPWDGDRLHRAHAELSASGQVKQARELLEQGLHDLDLEAPDLRALIEGDRERRLPVLTARLQELLGPRFEDTDLHRDGLFQVGATLALLGLRGQALQAYRHLAQLYPEDTPYKELRNLELGRTPLE